MPFVDDHQMKVAEVLLSIGARQLQRKTLRRGYQGCREPLLLTGAQGCFCVAGSCLQPPGDIEIPQGSPQGLLGIGNQRSQRGDPENAQRRISFAVAIHPLHDRAQPGRIGFSGSGGRVNQAAFTSRIGIPDFALKGKGLPSARGKPGIYLLSRPHHSFI